MVSVDPVDLGQTAPPSLDGIESHDRVRFDGQVDQVA
jgi:hypothetical protein